MGVWRYFVARQLVAKDMISSEKGLSKYIFMVYIFVKKMWMGKFVENKLRLPLASNEIVASIYST